MSYSPLSIKRRHILGNLYSRCENIESLPVYLEDASGELLGYVDESLGHYADAFSFHLAEDVCKKLSASGYTFAYDYDFVDKPATATSKSRIRLNHILLITRKAIGKKTAA